MRLSDILLRPSKLTCVASHQPLEQNQMFHVLHSPQSVLFFLPQVKVSLDDGPDVLGLVVRQLGEVQGLSRRGRRHDGKFECWESADAEERAGGLYCADMGGK